MNSVYIVLLFILFFYPIDNLEQSTSTEQYFSLQIISVFRKYKVPVSAIIPFPKRTDPSTATDFPTGRHVLAVYPGTTALYKATVVNGHRKVTIPPI